ncbi:hypothetical protein [Clostridium cylindrosporum]|uniref:Uncharacterized protein n=1 Tax=Clostridium cylindrosporum DSM 605 TaxID=1121307 RepID=A0A0J8DD73_CLOCY|nr:hypothetical protein [Clostridium cylindrosporum]KMT22194.1 hypothetical protein CLCY_4c01670 [Clostridium cylindrosporum DSM 605]
MSNNRVKFYEELAKRGKGEIFVVSELKVLSNNKPEVVEEFIGASYDKSIAANILSDATKYATENYKPVDVKKEGSKTTFVLDGEHYDRIEYSIHNVEVH